MSKIELKGCPFCNGEAELYYIGNDHGKKRSAEIKCTTFGCTSKIRVSALVHPLDWCAKKVSEIWNTRPREQHND